MSPIEDEVERRLRPLFEKVVYKNAFLDVDIA
jgi:hypothetical protein